MKGKRNLYALCTVALMLHGYAHAQITSMNSDRHSIAGARAASLADTYVAEPYDAVSMYTNPATLTWLLRRSVVLNYSLERILSTDNIMNENLAVPISLGRNVTLGMGATLSHVGHIRQVSPLSGFSYRQYTMDVAIGWSISRSVSLGAGVNGRYGTAGDATLSSFHGTIGALYSPAPDIVYGISVQGLGNGLGFVFDPVARHTTINRENLEKSLQYGVAWHFRNRAGDLQPIVTVAVANQKIFTIKGLVYKGGIEYIPITFLALRLGYWVGPDTKVAKLGVGLFLSRLEIDYAASPNELEPVTHQVTISYDFGSE